MSDMSDVGSDFEVLSDDERRDDDSFDENPIMKALTKPLEFSSSSSGSSSSEISTDDTVNAILQSMDDAVSSMAEDVLRSSNSDLTAQEDLEKEVENPQSSLSDDQLFDVPILDDPIAESSDSDSDSDLKVHDETRAILKNTIDKLVEFSEEKASMQERISQLEKTVERLNTKNKTLQRINENGTIFERRRRERSQRSGEENNEGEEEDEQEREEIPRRSRGCSWENVIVFSFFFASFVLLALVALQTWEHDERMEKLQNIIAKERRNTEQLRAELEYVGFRLNASLQYIEKMDKLLYSPIDRDFFGMMDADDKKNANNCFLRLNTTQNVCQRLTDLLEKEGHDNVLLKEKVRFMSGMAHIFLAIVVILGLGQFINRF